MLTTIHFDDELCSMVREIGDEVPDWNLPPEVLVRETLAKNEPKRPFGVGHIAAKAPGLLNSAVRWMMLHGLRSTMNITPPQPLPIQGRG
jgi:hypothetical protein